MRPTLRNTFTTARTGPSLANGARLLGLLAIALVLLSMDDLRTLYHLHWERHPPPQRFVVEHYLRAERLKGGRRYREALTEVEAAVGRPAALNDLTDWWKVRIYQTKADLHWALWHYVEAERAWGEALRYADTTDRPRIEQALHRSRYVIEQINGERDTRTRYRAAPGVGPSAAAHGRIAVVSLFIEDGGSGSWGPRQRGFVEDSWSRAQRWLSEAAGAYGSRPEFTHRSFLVDRHPRIRRLQVGGFGTTYRGEGEVIRLAVQQLGSPNVLSFLEQIKREEGAQQAVLLLYLERDDRSFAYRCLRGCTPNGEYAFVFGEAKPKGWQAMEYAQAHETLHLFGADDLYAIRDAKYFAPRDIMNYASSYLDASTLEPITAYAVGLLPDAPETPFEIVQH